MPKHQTVTIPGKVMLFGEHAVTYSGYSAVLLPLPAAACSVDILDQDHTENIRVIESALGLDLTFTYDELEDSLMRARKNYQTFLGTSDMASLSSYKELVEYMKLILALAADYIRQQHAPMQPVKLQLVSSIPVGGMGSSAAVAAALIKALVLGHDLELHRDRHYELTLEAERFQHGRPSGADPAVVVYNQPVYFHKDKTHENSIQTLSRAVIAPELLKYCYVLYSGQPKQSTGELVTYIRQYQENTTVMKAVEANTQEFLHLIQTGQLSEKSLIKLINTNGKLLEQLGVVSEVGQEISQIIRQAGGAVKVSGAGGRGKGPCGAMFMYLNNKGVLQELQARYTIYPMTMKGKK